jgi:hypothetical protein
LSWMASGSEARVGRAVTMARKKSRRRPFMRLSLSHGARGVLCGLSQLHVQFRVAAISVSMKTTPS